MSTAAYRVGTTSFSSRHLSRARRNPSSSSPTRSPDGAPRGAQPTRQLCFLDEADRPVRPQDRPLKVVERADLLQTHLLGHLVGGHALAAEVVLDQVPVLDDDERQALENLPRPLGAEAEA